MSTLSSFLIVGIISVSALSCDRRPEKTANIAASYGNEILAVAAPPDIKEEAVSQNAVDRQVIRRGNVEFKVDNLDETKKQVAILCTRYKAYVSSESRTNYEMRSQYEQEIRISEEHFDSLTRQIERLSRRIDAKSITSQDVTEEFIDVAARLKTKHELESRYRALLKQAKTVTEMLSIENQIGNVRAEIESMQGRLNYLKSQVAYSTLTIIFYENSGAESGFASKLANAAANGWSMLLLFTVGLTSVWPFLLIVAAAVWFLLRKKRRLPGPQPETISPN